MNKDYKLGFWDKIEAILVINLKHRRDRWDQIIRTMRQIGVEDKVVRIEAINGRDLAGYAEQPWFREVTLEKVARMKAGAAGCCLSHRKALEYAKSKRLNHYLVFEDDAQFDNLLLGREGQMISAVIQNPENWDLFYLGFYQRLNIYHSVKSEMIGENHFEIRRMRGPLLTHAFLVNSSVYEAMLAEMPTEKNIWGWIAYWGSVDSWIYNKFGRNRNVKIWGTMPRLVNQSADFSDICGRVQTIEESKGIHRKTKLISKDLVGLERSLNRNLFEVFYQWVKRWGRLMRAKHKGFSKC